MTLADIIEKVRADKGSEDDWLFIAGHEDDLSLGTDAELAPVETDEDNDFAEILPDGFSERGLKSSIDYDTLKGCIDLGDRLAGKPDATAACDIIRYYLRFDSCPARLNAPDPPSRQEILAKLDRDFYDCLGPEQAGTVCRHEGCTRGTILVSVFCRSHHFERVQKRPCPFTHTGSNVFLDYWQRSWERMVHKVCRLLGMSP